MSALTVPEVLRRAEQVIDERGWCQGDYTDEQGHVCLEGSVWVAIWDDPDGEPEDAPAKKLRLHDAALDAVMEHVGRYCTNWNDEPGRTEAEVRAALLAAADKAATS